MKPISTLTMGATNDVLQKSAATLIVTEELLRLPEASALLDAELRLAVTAASDKGFLFATLIAATTPTAGARAARSPTR